MIRNRLSVLLLGAFGLGALSAAGGSANALPRNFSPEVKAIAPRPIASAIKTARRIAAGRQPFPGTPYKTSGNRAQRRRQLAGMMIRNGAC